jgi:transposase
MARRLRPEEIVTIQVLAQQGMAKRAIARQLGLDESSVRYQLERVAKSRSDGRKAKGRKADPYEAWILHWIEAHKTRTGHINVAELYDDLVEQHGYGGSYRSVLRWIQARYPRKKIRAYRRIETVPGAQTQTDWGEFPRVHLGHDRIDLHAFVMVLSHSRQTALVWSHREDQLSWHRCHNEAFRRLGGVAAVNRIDNLKTGIAHGAGPWGEINPAYRRYARDVGFHVDACRVRQGSDKGKVEAKVRLGRRRVDPRKRRFDDLDDLQTWTDRRLERWSRKARCPATGLSVHDSWRRELPHLQPLPLLPEPFDLVVTRPVHKDCMVHFENHQYPVPFAYVGQRVEVRGCAEVVQIVSDGAVLRQYPRHTAEPILLDPSCYEGDSTDRVQAPSPLGKMGRRLQEIYDMPVQVRPMDLYAALAEVAR